ncbi:magnetosome protein MamN [Candidatus Magnetomorum sp. HK-1]|nr:magnetosome protein MamN [Candidatus Magnetomorum sp. HK-1]
MIVPQTIKNKIPIVTPEMAYSTRIKTVIFFNTALFLIVWSFWGNTISKDMGYSHVPTTNHLTASSILIPIVPAMDGPVVGQLSANSIPAKAGLRQGDVIIGVNGVLVTSPEMANYLIRSGLQTKTLKLRVLRQMQHLNISFQTDTSIRHKTLKVLSLPSSQQFIIMLVFLKLTIIMFFFIFKNIINRMIIVMIFASLMMLVGMVMRVYTPIDAFFSIKFNTISLLLGMGIISITLDEAGVFDYIAIKMTEYGGGSYLKILVLCCVLTYVLSLLVNNLTTILVIVPMTLNLALMNDIDPRPIIIGEIIASNLGGASTMVGDFPNMLISSETDVVFNEFIVYMMPICLVLLSVLLFYLHKLSSQRQMKMNFSGTVKKLKNFSNFTHRERRAVKRSVFVLFHVILLFSLSERLSLKPSAIALLGAMSLFLFSGIKKQKIIQRVGFNDILFFVGLFIVVGGLEASGLIHYASEFIRTISFSNKYASCLLIMWISALVTAFLSAGPTTALLFPIAISIQPIAGGHLIWWSLSLGVLAGSSSTLIGATAGPVAASLLEKFSTMYGVTFNGDNTIRYNEFLKIGLPMMGAFLGISSLYMIWLCSRI